MESLSVYIAKITVFRHSKSSLYDDTTDVIMTLINMYIVRVLDWWIIVAAELFPLYLLFCFH